MRSFVRPALENQKGGLVISCHNEIRDEWSDSASKGLSRSAVRDEPSGEKYLGRTPRWNPILRIFIRGRDILTRGLCDCRCPNYGCQCQATVSINWGPP
jgi:hypothetical protein